MVVVVVHADLQLLLPLLALLYLSLVDALQLQGFLLLLLLQLKLLCEGKQLCRMLFTLLPQQSLHPLFVLNPLLF
jgi:hypothetical protein